MTDLTHKNLSGTRFEDVSLTGADFHRVDLTGARFRLVDLTRVTISGSTLVDVDISGQIDNVRINGVDVAPLVEAELDRRYPDRAKMRPGGAAGYREAWEVLERLWQQTVARARRMDPELLHRRVNGEWSFIETLRHLVFATDLLVNRAILGQPSPWDPLDLPADEFPDEPGIPRDRDARPSLDQVLALRADRMATVRDVFASLSDEELAGMTQPVTGPGHPEPESFPVSRCLQAILDEEWEHRLYAERDLDALDMVPAEAPITRTVVADFRLPVAKPTDRVQVREIKIAPSQPAGLHVHNGPVFGSVVAGSVVYQIDGQAASVLRPGDVFYEPEGMRIARFDAQEDGVTFLAYFLLSPGQDPELTMLDE